MKHNANSLLLGLCLVFSLATATIPAEARSTTGFASFHVYNASANYYGCLDEWYGAVINNCGSPVTLIFDMPIINTGNHSVTVIDYWYSPAGKSFNCQSYAYDGHGAYFVGNSGPNYFTGGGQTITEYVEVPGNGDVMELVCYNIPAGAGIASVNWSD